jgi:hypothetical protein
MVGEAMSHPSRRWRAANDLPRDSNDLLEAIGVVVANNLSFDTC